MMRIAGVASAFPKHYYRQEVLLEALKRHWGERLDQPKFLARLHDRVRVEGRHLALPLEEYVGLETWGQANRKWIEVAQELGAEALAGAVVRAGLGLQDLAALFFVSVTGIASPSIDALMMNRMGLPANLRRVPIFGLGCVAGAAGISMAADYLRGWPGRVAALVSVELCSLTLQRDDLSVANLISSGLFADGAAAVVLTGAERHANGPEILATQSVLYPGTERVMGWDISEKGFRIVLSADVPDVVQQHLASDVDAFLGDQKLTRKDIGSWILHTGGPKILEATEAALGLNHGELDASWECLRKTGNLSSASVLLVLEEVMTRRRPAPGTLSVLAAMGPGFCSELLLLRW